MSGLDCLQPHRHPSDPRSSSTRSRRATFAPRAAGNDRLEHSLVVEPRDYQVMDVAITDQGRVVCDPIDEPNERCRDRVSVELAAGAIENRST